MKARLIYMSDGDDEFLVIDTENLPKQKLEEDHDAEFIDAVEIDGDLDLWPTDRLFEYSR